jgi:hypothetical protein
MNNVVPLFPHRHLSTSEEETVKLMRTLQRLPPAEVATLRRLVELRHTRPDLYALIQNTVETMP